MAARTPLKLTREQLDFSYSDFMQFVKKSRNCWEWQGRRIGKGYGTYQPLSCWSTTGAHRFSFQYTNGPIENPKLVVCHECDNPPCVRPSHLFLGTVKINSQDALKKGRLNAHLSKIHTINRGRKDTPETRLLKSITSKIRAQGQKSPMEGKHHSPETKLKLSLANKGKLMSEETKEKIRQANYQRYRK